MQTYIMLSSLTDEGRRTLKERPDRLREVNDELRTMGARVVEQLAVLGPHDFVNVIEAEDNAAAARVAVELGARGTVRLTTLPALPVEVPHPRRAPLPFRARPTTFVVYTKLTPEGRRALTEEPERLAGIVDRVAQLGARITHQYRVLGPHDYLTIVDAPSNEAATRVAAEVSALGTVRLQVHPAVALERFIELLRIKAYRTEPHRWQTQLWARAVRGAGWATFLSREIRQYCRPLQVEGLERLADVRPPCIVIANHTSHFDTAAIMAALPARLRGRTTVAAAADRFYRTNKRTWWYSLFWNTFPIARGGGSAGLDYPMWLLQHGWSILIYPEGGRFKPGQIQRFRHGPTILAKIAKVPVVPVYLEGLAEIMPRGVTTPRPGPVSVRFGTPIRVDDIDPLPAATAALEDAMRALAQMPARGAYRATEPLPAS